MIPIPLRTVSLRKTFGGVVAVDDATLQISAGELHALIGPNGAGKTTLIQLLSGAERADAGTIEVDGVDVSTLSMHRRVQLGLARSYQISNLFPAFTALENVALAVQARHGSPFNLWRPVAQRSEWFDRARDILHAVGLGARADTAAQDFSHGERRLLELGVALATGARLLLLDEPMAGLGPDELARFIALLETLKRRITILLVEHDMDAVFKLADRISTLVYGRVIATGTPDEIRADPEVRRAYLGEGVLS